MSDMNKLNSARPKILFVLAAQVSTGIKSGKDLFEMALQFLWAAVKRLKSPGPMLEGASHPSLVRSDPATTTEDLSSPSNDV